MKNLKCPRCKNLELTPFKHEGVTFDFCADGCKGIWADAGELAFYTETLGDYPNPERLTKDGINVDYPCPKCHMETMLELEYVPGKGPVIDVCNKCHGIWMDFKELGEIQEAARHFDNAEKIKRMFQDLHGELIKK